MSVRDTHLIIRNVILIILVSSFQVLNAREIKVDADVNSRVEYNDNIFITSVPHDSVSGLIVTPSLTSVVEDENWQTSLDARLRVNRYSDKTLNSNDQYLNINGQYLSERSTYVLNANYDLDSNLNSTSTDFGIVGQRVNREVKSISPQYIRHITERLEVLAAYTYTDVDYLEADATSYSPYISKMVALTASYGLTERDRLSFSFNAVDYKNKSDSIKYRLFDARIGIEHVSSETLDMDIQIGTSRRESVSQQSFNFFGALIPGPEVTVKDRGFVLNAGLRKKFEDSDVESRISRNNTTNSFGGLDQIDSITLSYDKKVTELWRSFSNIRYEDITSIGAGTSSTDRKLIFLETVMSYSLSKKWVATVSYRYIQRKLKNDSSNSRAPHSNRLYAGITYNFPSLLSY